MSDVTLLPGVSVDPRPDHPGFRVRVRFSALRVDETWPTADEANARVLELRKLKKAGLAPSAPAAEYTPRLACEGLLTRKAATLSRKTKRQLRPRGLEWWTRITKPWREGELADVPLSLLRRPRVEDVFLTRAALHPKAAVDELYGLKAGLRHAGERGAAFDQSILAIEPVARAKRRRRALSPVELAFLASHAPEYARRFVLFKGTVGNRVSELFTLTEDRVDIDASTIFIPAGLCKEAVDKVIDLTRPERQLLAEQLVARAAGTRLVWPTKTGRPWRYGDFHRLVWSKTVTRAALAWREEHRLDDRASTPFEWQLLDDRGEPRFNEKGLPVLDRLEPHDLRATAATLMRDAGLTKEQAAARLGHADSGQLLDQIYDLGDRRERAQVRAALDNLADDNPLARALEAAGG